MSQTLSFHHSLLIGDLMYALPGIKQVCQSYQRKAIIYLGLNKVRPMAPQIMRRGGITMTEEDFLNYKPLLLRQSYIEDVRIHSDEEVAVNLDEIMGPRAKDINVPYGHISKWYSLIWPDMATDLSQKWLEIDERIQLFSKQVIIISRSARSHNPHINYAFLEKYKDRLFFIGLDDEWMSFCKQFFPVHHYKVQSFLEMAIAINSCKFFVGNQSFPYAIAEALKVPRVLELYIDLPHIIPIGPNAYDFVYQDALEYYVEQLNKL